MHKQGALTALAVGATTFALTPAVAQAAAVAVVELEDGRRGYAVATDPGVDDGITVYQGTWRGRPVVTFGTIDGGTRITEHPGCEVDPTQGFNCPADGIEFVLIDGGDGNDTLRGDLTKDSGVRVPMVLVGGPGKDVLGGGLVSDVVVGDEGADALTDTPGQDAMDAGAGDDRVASNGPNFKGDTFDGGEGVDTIGVGREAPSTWSLDGQANDGEAGEGDNAIGFENLDIGSEAPVVASGNDGPNVITGGIMAGKHTLRGLGGDDLLVGTGLADTLEGGPGKDTLKGQEGDDLLDGGPGTDSIIGDGQSSYYGYQAGNDVIQARDGEVDAIDCGIGADRAVVDANDAVSSCTSVDRGPEPPKPTPTTPTTTTPKPGPAVTTPAGPSPSGGGGAAGPVTPGGVPAAGERPRLVLTAPVRDRRAPFRFTLRGRATGARDCAGERVRIEVRRGARVVLRRTATLDRRCAFTIGLRLTGRGRHVAIVSGAGLQATHGLRAG